MAVHERFEAGVLRIGVHGQGRTFGVREPKGPGFEFMRFISDRRSTIAVLERVQNRRGMFDDFISSMMMVDDGFHSRKCISATSAMRQ